MSSTAQSTQTSPTAGSLYSFFGPGGVLARAHPQYEFRRGQLQMAEAVEQTLREGRHLIVEAGTGTGKTLAYLLPAIRSGKRIVVSTGTKNLQEQLFYKDIPFLQQALFPRGEGELRYGPVGGMDQTGLLARYTACACRARGDVSSGRALRG